MVRLWLLLAFIGSILGSLCFMAFILLVGTIGSGDNTSAAGCLNAPLAQSSVMTNAPGWDAEQREIAGLIIGIGRERGFSDRDIKIALMTAMQEAKLRNPTVMTDHDSLGVYQQRKSQGWGTAQQIIDPVYAINKFYDALARVKNREKMSLLDVALAVQNPSRKAYLSSNNYFPGWEDEADALLAGRGAATSVAARRPMQVCNDQPADQPVVQAANGWQLPLRDGYRLISGYGTRTDPNTHEEGAFHDGLDFAVRAGTPIYAVTNGVVIEARVTKDSGGWGNTTVIDHGTVKTRYAHMQHPPFIEVGKRVKAGDRIGEVGKSGKSTGNHLHLSVYEGGQVVQRTGGPVYVPGKSLDPLKFLQDKGLKP